jgi:hypothetical protein
MRKGAAGTPLELPDVAFEPEFAPELVEELPA